MYVAVTQFQIPIIDHRNLKQGRVVNGGLVGTALGLEIGWTLRLFVA